MMALTSLITALLAASIAQAQPALTIAISASRTRVPAKSPVELQVALKNTANHDIHLFVDKSSKAELSGFGADVTDAQGLVPKITAYYNQLSGENAPRGNVANPDEQFIIVSSGGDVTVARGGAIELHMDIGKLYDLTKPGTYAIQVTLKDAVDATTIKSNSLKITVTE